MNEVKQPQERNISDIKIHKGITSIRKERAYKRKKRACGVALLVIAILTAIISQDSTVAVLLVPIAIYIIITNKHVMCF